MTESQLTTDVKAAVDTVIQRYKADTAGGSLSLHDVFVLIGKAVATLTQLIEKYSGYDGPTKKAAVLAALGDFFDEVIQPLDLKAVPNFVEPIVDRSLREFLMAYGGALIDVVVNIFNTTSWGTGEQSPSVVVEGADGGYSAASFKPF